MEGAWPHHNVPEIFLKRARLPQAVSGIPKGVILQPGPFLLQAVTRVSLGREAPAALATEGCSQENRAQGEGLGTGLPQSGDMPDWAPDPGTGPAASRSTP